MSEITTLADALPKEIDRVRGIIKEYEDPLLDGAGAFAAAMMKGSIKMAEKAIMAGDVVQMLACYKDLQEFSL